MSKTSEAFNAEVIDFEEAAEARTKASGDGGGYDHFTGMILGTAFASMPNGVHGSYCDDYQLLSRSGPTVLLLNRQEEKMERHIGSKFWKLNTLVQILHVPEKDNNNGNRVPD